MSEQKKIPNPDGRKGCEKHRSLIKKIIDYFLENKITAIEEPDIDVGNGKKRYPDIAVLNEQGKIVEIHQVGVQTKAGNPVAREQKAINEIEKVTGIKVFFHSYKTLLILWLIFISTFIVVTLL